MTIQETSLYRPGLPPVPRRLLHLPVVRGYPVPYFVAKQPDGTYDFRVADFHKRAIAIKEARCWICGQPLGAYKAFTIGPMCAVNRTSAEPPAHSECAHWAAIACPFLNQQQSRRREGDLPEVDLPPGEMLTRQPGVTLVWTTKAYRLFDDGRGGWLIRIGEPTATAWYAHGRAATRDEVLASIESGTPILRGMAEEEGAQAVKMLESQIARAMQYLPPVLTSKEA